MKRRIPIPRNIPTLLSLLLLIAAATMWVRSYFWQDGISYTRVSGERYKAWGLSGHAGSLMYMYVSAPMSDRVKPGWSCASPRRRVDSFLVRWSHWGFWAFSSNLYRNDPSGGVPFTQAGVPYWFIMLVAGILPTVSWVRHRRRRRQASVGRCPGCGYDLRATPDHCPECGHTPASPMNAVS